MSMIIVTLTSIIQFTPEQEQSYNEIVNLDPETIKKIRHEATIVIQAAWRDRLARSVLIAPSMTKEEKSMIVKKKIVARLELVAISMRYKYKRLNVSNANPQLANIITDLKANVNDFLEEGMKNLNIYKTEVTKQVGEMRQNQFKMDAKILKMYDVTMRLNSFLVACNRGEAVEGSKFNTTKNLYTHRRAKMGVNAVKEYMLLFEDARAPADKFYESYRPAERVLSPSGLDQKNLELEDHLNKGQGNELDYIKINVGEEQISNQTNGPKEISKKSEHTRNSNEDDQEDDSKNEDREGEEELGEEEVEEEEIKEKVTKKNTITGSSKSSKRSRRSKKK